MCARGQIFPSETRESGFPVILTAFPFSFLTRMAQRAGQFRQEVAIHFSSGGPGVFRWRGMAECPSDFPKRWLAPMAAPVTTESLRNFLRFTFKLFCPFLIENDSLQPHTIIPSPCQFVNYRFRSACSAGEKMTETRTSAGWRQTEKDIPVAQIIFFTTSCNEEKGLELVVFG
jgi:hypothetical protein